MQGLVVDAVSKSYGPVAALMALSFSIKPGQFTALLGPNGAGKTTLFQVLSGLFRPDTGSITIDGIRMDQNPAKALSRLGVIFQQQSLDVSMSVEQNLRFHAALHGLPRSVANERIAAGLNQFALAEQSGRLVRELSGGNKRKVELIRAMLHQPAILLADEATVGLDPASRAGLLKEVHHCVATQQCEIGRAHV